MPCFLRAFYTALMAQEVARRFRVGRRLDVLQRRQKGRL